MISTFPVIASCPACGTKSAALRKRMRRHAEGSKKGANAVSRRISITLMKSSSPAGSQGPNEEVHKHRQMVLLAGRLTGMRKAPPRQRISISTSVIRTRKEGRLALSTFTAKTFTYALICRLKRHLMALTRRSSI